MKVLLHACCADCALKFVESIKEDKQVTELVFYYYNPNIHPRSEYQSRLKAMKQIADENKIKLVIPDWKPMDYFKRVNSSVDESTSPSSKEDLRLTEREFLEKPKRCVACWNLRLEETATYAQKNGFEMFASTLVTSQYQDNLTIKKIAQSMAKKYKLEFYVPELICTELKTSGFYKQFFCGCCYSLAERMNEKFVIFEQQQK